MCIRDSPEKAIVDIYYFKDVNDLDEEMLRNPPRLSISRLVLYAKESRSKRVARGIAELLSMNGHSKEAKSLISM